MAAAARMAGSNLGAMKSGCLPLFAATIVLLAACGAPTGNPTNPGSSDPASSAPAATSAPPATTAAAPPSSAAPATSQTAPPAETSTAPATPVGDPVTQTDVFNGYSLELPAGTVRTGSTTGEWGEVRTFYQTLAGEQLTTIAFSPDFGWSELSEELTTACPTAEEGPQTPINWGGSYQGGYTTWQRSPCGQSTIVTFTSFGEAENIAVIYDADTASPADWVVTAVERANWQE